MMPMTPDEVRAKLQKEGKTIKQWALEHGYDQNRVYRVLGGFEKSSYGKSHQIAVDLGLKAGVETGGKPKPKPKAKAKAKAKTEPKA